MDLRPLLGQPGPRPEASSSSPPKAPPYKPPPPPSEASPSPSPPASAPSKTPPPPPREAPPCPPTSSPYKTPPGAPPSPPASAPCKTLPPPPPQPPQPSSPSTKTPATGVRQGGGSGGGIDQAPQVPQPDAPTKAPAAVPGSKFEGTSGDGTTGDQNISRENFEPGGRTSDPAAKASLTATRMPPAAGSSLEADESSLADQEIDERVRLEREGTSGMSSGGNSQDPPPPPPPAAATAHGSRWSEHLLPVTHPPPAPENGRSFRECFESCIGELLPDCLIQLRVAVCGFSLYGIMSLLGSTQGLVKDSLPNNQALVFVGIGFLWAMTSITVAVTMSARTRFGRALSQHGTRLALVGITTLVLFHIIQALPQNFWREEGASINVWSAVGTVFLIALASIGHFASWVVSGIYGETERKPAQERS